MTLPFLRGRQPVLRDPRQLSGIAAWFDALDPASMIVDSSNRVSLWADKSSNSPVIAFCSDGTASNTATTATKVLTGNQTMTFDLGPNDWTPGTNHTLFSKLTGNNGLEILLLTTGVIRVRVGDGAAVTNFDSTAANALTDLTRHTLVITYVDNTSVAFTLDGVALGTTVVVNKTLANGATTATIGTSFAGRIYRVQIGSLYDFNPSTGTKLAATLADGVSGTWTINTSGASGARLSGERDLYQGTVASQPVLLRWQGDNYGYLNGASGNYFSTPDSVPLSVTGDIDIRVKVAMADWTPAADSCLISKTGAAGQLSWQLQIQATTGKPYLMASVDGTATSFGVASVAPTVADMATLWIRATRVSASGVVTFYTSPDGTTWTQLGTTASTTAGAIFDSTAAVQIGVQNTTGNLCAGNFYRAQILSGIAGTLVFDFDASRYTNGSTVTEGSSNTATVTLNGAATIVTRTCLYFDGSDDFIMTPRFLAPAKAMNYLVLNPVSWTANKYIYDTVTAFSAYLRKKPAGVSPQINLQSAIDTSALPVGTWGVIASYFGLAGLLRVNRGLAVTGDTSGATLMNGITLGGSGGGGNYSNDTISEFINYAPAAAQSVSTQDSLILYAGRKWRIAV